MTAKFPASKTKAAPAKARRVVKAAATPALKATAVTPAKVPAAKVVVVAAKPVPAAAAKVTLPAPIIPAAKPALAIAPTPSVRVVPIAAPVKPKEIIMATATDTTKDAVRTTVNQINTQAETAINSGKAAMEQVAAKSKEAVEASMKSLDELSEMTRANVDALVASARAATAGVEQVMTHLTETSKKSFEDTSAMVKTLASAKTPNELMQLQSEYAKAQFDSAVSEYSKLTEMMVKLAGEVMEPVQNQVALATDRMKAVWTVK